jgi:hypothetical protein
MKRVARWRRMEGRGICRERNENQAYAHLTINYETRLRADARGTFECAVAPAQSGDARTLTRTYVRSLVTKLKARRGLGCALCREERSRFIRVGVGIAAPRPLRSRETAADRCWAAKLDQPRSRWDYCLSSRGALEGPSSALLCPPLPSSALLDEGANWAQPLAAPSRVTCCLRLAPVVLWQ